MNFWFISLRSTRMYLQNNAFIFEEQMTSLCDIAHQKLQNQCVDHNLVPFNGNRVILVRRQYWIKSRNISFKQKFNMTWFLKIKSLLFHLKIVNYFLSSIFLMRLLLVRQQVKLCYLNSDHHLSGEDSPLVSSLRGEISALEIQIDRLKKELEVLIYFIIGHFWEL